MGADGASPARKSPAAKALTPGELCFAVLCKFLHKFLGFVALRDPIRRTLSGVRSISLLRKAVAAAVEDLGFGLYQLLGIECRFTKPASYCDFGFG